MIRIIQSLCHYSIYNEKTCFDYPVVINMFTSIVLLYTQDQGCTNPGWQVARTTKILFRCASYLWALSVVPGARYLSGAQNFEVFFKISGKFLYPCILYALFLYNTVTEGEPPNITI